MSWLMAAVAALTGVACVHACGEAVLHQNFDSYSGDYVTWTKEMGKVDLPGLIFLKFDDYSAAGDGNYRIMNKLGCYGTKDCGATYDVQLDPMNEATLSYKFKHADGYIYGLGGKLPGLCADDCPSGCANVGPENGFSARVMWRADRENPSATELVSYSYYAGMTETNCGENWYWNTPAVAGVWHDLKMYVKLNDPGQSNGVQTIEYDGVEVYYNDAIQWAFDPASHPIEKFTFRSFHGGGNDEWASAQDQYIFFDDITVNDGNCLGGGMAIESTAPVSAIADDSIAADAPTAADAPETTTTDATRDEDGGDSGDTGAAMPAEMPAENSSTSILGSFIATFVEQDDSDALARKQDESVLEEEEDEYEY